MEQKHGGFRLIVKLAKTGEWKWCGSAKHVLGLEISDALWANTPTTDELEDARPAFGRREMFVRTIDDVVGGNDVISDGGLYRLAKRVVDFLSVDGAFNLAKTPKNAMTLADLLSAAKGVIMGFGWLEQFNSEEDDARGPMT